jgi:prevent-host-death family protein
MKVFTYSEARQRFSSVLDTARKEEVLIKRRGGELFSLTYKTTSKSPFDVPSIKTKATTADILDAIRESRSKDSEQG